MMSGRKMWGEYNDEYEEDDDENGDLEWEFSLLKYIGITLHLVSTSTCALAPNENLPFKSQPEDTALLHRGRVVFATAQHLSTPLEGLVHCKPLYTCK